MEINRAVRKRKHLRKKRLFAMNKMLMVCDRNSQFPMAEEPISGESSPDPTLLISPVPRLGLVLMVMPLSQRLHFLKHHKYLL